MEWYKQQRTLKDALEDWRDWDLAAYHLAVFLGLLIPDRAWGGRKDLFWTNNDVGNLLHEMLRGLIKLGVIEHDEDTDMIRWRKSFVLE